MTSFLGIPIQAGEQLLGILYLTDKENGQPFDDADQWLAETMSRYAALAIASSQLRNQQQEGQGQRNSPRLPDIVIGQKCAVQGRIQSQS